MAHEDKIKRMDFSEAFFRTEEKSQARTLLLPICSSRLLPSASSTHSHTLSRSRTRPRVHVQAFTSVRNLQFSPDITPLVLAAHNNNHEIIQMFLSRHESLMTS